MKDSIVIKSNKYGLTLVLNNEISFEQLVRDICYKFANSRDFFGSKEMIITYIGRDITPEESAVIVEAIELNSDIKITLIHEDNEIKDLKMIKEVDRFYYDKIYQNAKIIRGNVTSKNTISSKHSIIILGDIKSNASVKAAGNVIVFGSVEGEVCAGYPDNNKCYIIANEMLCNTARIGSTSGEFSIQKKWFQRAKKASQEPLAIVQWEGELIAEPIRSGILKQL